MATNFHRVHDVSNAQSTEPTPLWGPRTSRVWRLVGLGYTALIAAAVVLFVTRHAEVVTPAFANEAAAGELVDLASPAAGATLRVSSYDLFRSHHPLYAVDGEEHPLEVEKWATLTDDRQPFLEVHFAGPAQLERVALDLAGVREPVEYSMSDFTVTCLRDGEPVGERAVHDNHEVRVELELDCQATDTVRVDFTVFDEGPLQVVRLYELEAWGRLAPRDD